MKIRNAFLAEQRAKLNPDGTHTVSFRFEIDVTDEKERRGAAVFLKTMLGTIGERRGPFTLTVYPSGR